MNQPRGHMLRKGRFSEEGRIYLVTTVTAQRQPFFTEFSKARAMVRILHAYSKPAQTLAYVLTCRIPDDCIDLKRHALFVSRAMFAQLIEDIKKGLQ